MDYSLKEVAGRIKDLREAKGYTQEELAKLTGVSVEDYKVLEMGETDFSFTFIYKCAKACDVEVVDLLEGTNTNREQPEMDIKECFISPIQIKHQIC